MREKRFRFDFDPHRRLPQRGMREQDRRRDAAADETQPGERRSLRAGEEKPDPNQSEKRKDEEYGSKKRQRRPAKSEILSQIVIGADGH